MTGVVGSLAGCATAGNRSESLRKALAHTLRVSKSDGTLLVRTSAAFEHDVLVSEAGYQFVLSLPGLEGSTTRIVPRETVRFFARDAGSDGEYVHFASYTEPLPDAPVFETPPAASVRFDRRDGTEVECVLERLRNAETVRLAYPDDRPDDVLLWVGHRVTVSGLDRGTIRVFASKGTTERLVDRYSVG